MGGIEVFLDTTIQIDRNFTPKQGKIDNILNEKALFSSTYVFGEYKRNILKDAITFYNLLEQSDSTEEALSRLGEVLFSTRQFDRVMKIFSTLVEDGKMSKKDVKKRLSFLIEETIITRFMRGLTNLFNETECQRAMAYPEMIDGMWKLQNISCRQNPEPSCKIMEFIEKHKKLLENICELPQENLKEVVSILKECLNSRTRPYGKNCMKLSDATICCEVPDHFTIFTTNKKDFIPICQVIGRVLFDPDESITN